MKKRFSVDRSMPSILASSVPLMSPVMDARLPTYSFCRRT